MRTSEDARESALYTSGCCSIEMLFDIGDCFCRCPRCSGLCEWEIVEPVLSWTNNQWREFPEAA